MRRWMIGLAVAAVVSGCSSSHHPLAVSAPTTPAATATTTATPSTTAATNYGTRYLAIIGPVNTAIKSFPDNPTPAQLSALSSQIDHAEGQLLAVAWPGQAETDARSLATAMGQLAAAVSNDDSAGVNTSGQAVASAAGILRADLGLPSNL